MRIKTASIALGLALVAVVAAVGLVGGGVRKAASENSDDWEVIVVPTPVVAGEHFHVYARFSGNGGLATMWLVIDDAAPIVAVQGSDEAYFSSSFRTIAHDWTVSALEPGTAHLRMYVYYEKIFPCDEPDCVPVTSFVSSEYRFSVEIERPANATSTPTPAPSPTPEPAPLAGDHNHDGRVDSRDALLILQYAAGLIDSLGGE